MTKDLQLSRRAVLRGLGVTMFLPLLEAMEPHAALARGPVPRAPKPPVRFAALYMANGVNPHLWSPEGFGSGFTLSPILAPLAARQKDILVLTELMNHQSEEGDGHYVKVAPFLTGTHITKTTGSNLRSGGISVDQLIAQRIGNQTPLPSLELSIEPVTNGVDTNVGFTRLYGSHISWSTPTTPVTRENDPRAAFDRLFRRANPIVPIDPHAAAEDQSVLDLVLEDTRRLQKRVGQADRVKLGEYFDSVRSVEKRIAYDSVRRSDEVRDDPECRKTLASVDGRITSYYAVPEGKRGIDTTEQVRLMMDILALAFWTDSTRVGTFMFANEVSGKNFSFLPGVSGGHHEISHHSNDKSKLEQYAKINAWHVEQYAYLLDRLAGIREGNGTLLDNSMILFGSGMKDGNAHSPFNLPIVVGGRGGGALSTGRHLIYKKETPLCNLYHTVLDAMDCPVEHFGDSTGELTGLADPAFAGRPADV